MWSNTYPNWIAFSLRFMSYSRNDTRVYIIIVFLSRCWRDGYYFSVYISRNDTLFYFPFFKRGEYGEGPGSAFWASEWNAPHPTTARVLHEACRMVPIYEDLEKPLHPLRIREAMAKAYEQCFSCSLFVCPLSPNHSPEQFPELPETLLKIKRCLKRTFPREDQSLKI